MPALIRQRSVNVTEPQAGVSPMPYTVFFDAPAQRDIAKLPPRLVDAVLAFAYEALAENPRRVGKPLRFELTGLFSARRGPYRVLYEIDEENQAVHIVRLRHRADAYRKS